MFIFRFIPLSFLFLTLLLFSVLFPFLSFSFLFSSSLLLFFSFLFPSFLFFYFLILSFLFISFFCFPSFPLPLGGVGWGVGVVLKLPVSLGMEMITWRGCRQLWILDSKSPPGCVSCGLGESLSNITWLILCPQCFPSVFSLPSWPCSRIETPASPGTVHVATRTCPVIRLHAENLRSSV